MRLIFVFLFPCIKWDRHSHFHRWENCYTTEKMTHVASIGIGTIPMFVDPGSASQMTSFFVHETIQSISGLMPAYNHPLCILSALELIQSHDMYQESPQNCSRGISQKMWQLRRLGSPQSSQRPTWYVLCYKSFWAHMNLVVMCTTISVTKHAMACLKPEAANLTVPIRT